MDVPSFKWRFPLEQKIDGRVLAPVVVWSKSSLQQRPKKLTCRRVWSLKRLVGDLLIRRTFDPLEFFSHNSS